MVIIYMLNLFILILLIEKIFKFYKIRSIWHGGVTFAKTRNTTLIQFFSIILFFVILFYGFFVNKRHLLQGLFIGFILSGDLGNMLDRFIFNGYVKDVFYIPFLEYLFKKTLVFLILLMSVFL
ncbi:signal peptidase II [Mycoplasmopsis felis]|uniref:signal peptidase II n=1 Tax=Mycoplasmopsis felis TaxID=33923 RepID=UPI0021DF4F29|nr:signal peptidase II [Mycoplasmopsis felis]MCU9934441.1 signal peptidase II [Mycoplasmopsis felis]